MDELNSEIRKQARFIDSRKEVIPLEKSVLIQYCDMQAEIKELRRLVRMTEERLDLFLNGRIAHQEKLKMN